MLFLLLWCYSFKGRKKQKYIISKVDLWRGHNECFENFKHYNYIKVTRRYNYENKV